MRTFYIALLAQGAVLALMVFLYGWSRRKRDLGVVDLGWTLGVGLSGVIYALLLDQGFMPRRILVASLAGVWSLRLALHIYAHRVRGKDEDARYQRLRAHWGNRAAYLVPAFFAVQAPLAILFSLPLLIAMANPTPTLTWWDGAGILIWIVSVAGETAADRQLERFRSDPANRSRTCRNGLWGYSRHPNYFFEWIHWFAYVPMAAGAPFAWAALLGPAMMLIFLFGITGIPHTERQALVRRGDDYRRYQQTTSVFIPWFRRREVRL